MKVHVPGHYYQLETIDGHRDVTLRFVSRKGPGYPGNEYIFAGTNNQEVLRVLIDRTQYLNKQMPSWTNRVCILLYRIALNLLEWRAARRHRRWFWPKWQIERIVPNERDGHIR